MIRCYIGLGSNLDQPVEQLGRALQALQQLPDSRWVGASSLYCSPPLGPQDQPDFINAVACLDTLLPPLELLAALQAIEQQHQRVRLRHWGPRTLDLDLLLYGDQSLDLPQLTVPHPGLALRDFVLWPLAELEPSLCLPDGRSVQALCQSLPPSALKPLNQGSPP